MIYKNSAKGMTPDMLIGFFDGWGNPPDPETHLTLLNNSSKVIIAFDEGENRAAGFITAVSDGVLSAYIPLLEVLPEYKNQGIGRELVRRMLEKLKDIYMIDLCCDDDLIPFYKKFGMVQGNSMLIRNYDRQSGS